MSTKRIICQKKYKFVNYMSGVSGNIIISLKYEDS